MQKDITLQRFRRFKDIIVAADVPSNLLLEMIESYLASDNGDDLAEGTLVLDGQISLFDYKLCT